MFQANSINQQGSTDERQALRLHRVDYPPLPFTRPPALWRAPPHLPHLPHLHSFTFSTPGDQGYVVRHKRLFHTQALFSSYNGGQQIDMRYFICFLLCYHTTRYTKYARKYAVSYHTRRHKNVQGSMPLQTARIQPSPVPKA